MVLLVSKQLVAVRSASPPYPTERQQSEPRAQFLAPLSRNLFSNPDEMGALMRSFDWSNNAVGLPEF